MHTQYVADYKWLYTIYHNDIFFVMAYISKYKHKPKALLCNVLQIEALTLITTKIATGCSPGLALTTFSASDTSVYVI